MKETDYTILMLGDSLTEWGDWPLLLERDDVLNVGAAGYTTPMIAMMLERVLQSHWAPYCFTMGGINDLYQGADVEEVLMHYIQFLKVLKGQRIQPIVQLTLYVYGDAAVNAQVSKFNQLLSEYCRTHGLRVLDLNPTMSDRQSLLPAYTSDGVHLSAKGYEAWAGVLRSYLANLLDES